MEQNLSLYHVFNCVAGAGSISRAANQLFISQPAVSKAISTLEADLGTTLFVRSSRGVKLTREGELLYEHTLKAFDALKQGEDALKRIQDLGIGYLRIGVSATLCKYLLLPCLKQFVSENPHIRITIDIQSTTHTLKGLSEGVLDIGLVAKPLNPRDYVFHRIGMIEDIFAASPGYLDNLRLREGDQDIFSRANIMLLDEENISRKYIEDYFKTNHIELKQVLEVSSMDLLIEFAKTGLGIACVVKEFIADELARGQLVSIPLKKPVNKREVGFCYMQNTFLSDSMRKFISHIRSDTSP
jgi:DNA-binding transcriptional LysR family regulator